VSTDFEAKSLIQRHRMVYKALSDLLETDIHALSIQAFTPNQFSAV
jgi:BolA protein